MNESSNFNPARTANNFSAVSKNGQESGGGTVSASRAVRKIKLLPKNLFP